MEGRTLFVHPRGFRVFAGSPGETHAAKQNPCHEAERGPVDEGADPAGAREVLIQFLATLRTEHADLPSRRLGNPLRNEPTNDRRGDDGTGCCPACRDQGTARRRLMVKQERALRTRQALIRAGAELFAREGFVAASLSTISRTAGVSNGALHFHFENKRALAQAIEDQALATLRQVIQEAQDRDGRALPVLVDATYGLVSRIADDAVVRAGFELGDDPGRGEGALLRREWQYWVEEMVGRAERDGWLAPGISADDAATAVVAATVGFEVLGGENRAWLSEGRVNGFWRLLLPRLTERHALVSPAWAERSGRVVPGRSADDGT